MSPNPFLGVLYHWTGGLAAASFYIPFRRVQRWAWETYWLVGGVFSWIVVPWVIAVLLVPDVPAVISATPPSTLTWVFAFGALWGLGGLTFGLTVRYLGIALGVAVALGLCNAFGTLVPPIFSGEFDDLARSRSGTGHPCRCAGVIDGDRRERTRRRFQGARTARRREAGGCPGVRLPEGHAGRHVLRNHERLLRVRDCGRGAAGTAHTFAIIGLESQ